MNRKKVTRPEKGPYRAWLFPALLFAVVFFSYQPIWQAGFIWDDDQYVTENLTLRSLDGLRQIWFTPESIPQYYPLVHTTFWMEYHLWGLHPLGYHLVNVLLHALAAWLFYRVLTRLNLPGAWLAAAIFALHPVQVESVAWVTERKNVLSAVFYFASALAWLRFGPIEESTAGRNWKWYWVSLALFIGALLSKTVACSLPAALLLALWWKKGRVVWEDVRPLLSFFLVGAALGLSTAWIEKHHVGAEGHEWALTFGQRLLIAGRALWFYAEKLVWPTNLTFIYPRWNVRTDQWWQWLFPVAAAAALAALWVARNRIGRGSVAAALLFCGTLGPALGFINIYPMRYSFVADHFQYLAAIGLFILFAAWASRWPRWAFGPLLCVLAVLTWRQTGMYHDKEILWRTTLARNPGCLMARNKLGVMLLDKGQVDKASALFQSILEEDPDSVEAHCNMGLIKTQQGLLREAEAEFQKSLREEPNFDVAHNDLGSVFSREGRFEEAITELRRAIELNPGYLNARLNLGLALANEGKTDEAVSEFQRCLVLDPDSAAAHSDLGDLLQKRGNVGEAITNYEAALAVQPYSPLLLNNLAWIRAANADPHFRDGTEAVRLAEQACRLTDSNVPVILNTLGAAYAEAGRFEEAVAAAERAQQLAIAMGHKEAADQVAPLIALYKSHQPFHETPK